MIAHGTSQRSNSLATSSSRPWRTMISIRSCDSESITSYGVIPFSLRGTFATSISMPLPPRLADSTAEDVRPAAPRSWMPVIQSTWFQARSRHASSSIFSRNGLPTCTAGRISSKRALGSVREASPDAPWMPSRPVSAPTSISRLPAPSAFAVTSWSTRAMPTHMALTSGLSA